MDQNDEDTRTFAEKLPAYQRTQKYKQGLARKFDVSRVDGRDAPGQKHYGCFHLVLDLDHDPHARVAVAVYASECKQDYPKLAKDLLQYLADHPLKAN